MPDPPASRKTDPSTPETQISQTHPFGEPAFEIPQSEDEGPIPPYAGIARPVNLRGTGGMDPIAQQIVGGLAPQFQELKQAIAGPKGWEALGQSIATILDRAIQPIAQSTPSQPLPALVAPDPRVETMETRLNSLESNFSQAPSLRNYVVEKGKLYNNLEP
jgi:hypothetical protein